MCLTLPAKIISIDKFNAVISVNGKNQQVKIGTSENLAVGDFVLYTGDYLIKKINQEEADEILDLLSSYKKVDLNVLDSDFKKIIEASKIRDLRREEIEYLLNVENEEFEALCSEANIVRKESIKDHICIHGIIEFSSYCKNNCHYCGLRCENTSPKRYRMSSEEIIETTVNAVNDKGYKILVLQSGEDDFYDDDKLVDIIKEIKAKSRVFLYLSVGDRSVESYKKLKEAGANGVLYRFETSDSEMYAKLHPGKNLEERIDSLKMMKKLGFAISTGMIIGLPEQTTFDLANDIMLMKELGTFMPSMGPLIPSSGTPLAGESQPNFDLIRKLIAVSRLVMPTSRIPVTTAMETIGGDDSRQKCFMAGANSVMFNLTPEKYRKDYYIYENKFYDKEKKYEKWALFKGELSYQMMEEELKIKI